MTITNLSSFAQSQTVDLLHTLKCLRYIRKTNPPSLLITKCVLAYVTEGDTMIM